MLDCVIACHHCHANVCYIMMMTDYFSHLRIGLNRVGYYCCKDYFSLLCQQVHNKHNFYIGEAVEYTSKIAKTKKIKHEKDDLLFSNSRYWKNLWLKGNSNNIDLDVDFLDYNLVTNPKLEKAWEDGLFMVRENAKYVEMEDLLKYYSKWDKPWVEPWASSFDAFIQDISISLLKK